MLLALCVIGALGCLALVGVFIFVRVHFVDELYVNSGPSSWRENVKLQDGTVIEVMREKRYGAGDIGSKGGPLVYASLEFTHRGQHIKWESTNSGPYLLQVDAQGRPVVAAGIYYDWARDARGNPCDGSVVEYFENERWHQIPSWKIAVSREWNLAADRERGLKGIAWKDQLPSGGPTDYSINEKRCLLEQARSEYEVMSPYGTYSLRLNGPVEGTLTFELALVDPETQRFCRVSRTGQWTGQEAHGVDENGDPVVVDEYVFGRDERAWLQVPQQQAGWVALIATKEFRRKASSCALGQDTYFKHKTGRLAPAPGLQTGLP